MNFNAFKIILKIHKKIIKTDPGPDKVSFKLVEIVLTTHGIQNLFEFYMLPTLQQSFEDFPLELTIHRKDNSPKPVNHRLTLKEEPKVKSDIRKFPAHNILQVGFTMQTSRINNRRVITLLSLDVLV